MSSSHAMLVHTVLFGPSERSLAKFTLLDDNDHTEHLLESQENVLLYIKSLLVN